MIDRATYQRICSYNFQLGVAAGRRQMRKGTDMDEKIAAKVHTLLEDVYAAGIKAGRELERADIVKSLSGAAKTTRAPRQPAASNGNGHAAAEPPAAAKTDGLEASIGLALVALAPEHPDGIFPDAIAEYVKREMDSDVSVAAIRQTLRQMTLSGKARRLPRGRYASLPMAPPPGSLFRDAPPT